MQIPLSLAIQSMTIQPKFTITQETAIVFSSTSHSNIFIDTPTTRDPDTSYSNNSNNVFSSELIFEKHKVTKLKNDLLDDLKIEIKDIIKRN